MKHTAILHFVKSHFARIHHKENIKDLIGLKVKLKWMWQFAFASVFAFYLSQNIKVFIAQNIYSEKEWGFESALCLLVTHYPIPRFLRAFQSNLDFHCFKGKLSSWYRRVQLA